MKLLGHLGSPDSILGVRIRRNYHVAELLAILQLLAYNSIPAGMLIDNHEAIFKAESPTLLVQRRGCVGATGAEPFSGRVIGGAAFRDLAVFQRSDRGGAEGAGRGVREAMSDSDGRQWNGFAVSDEGLGEEDSFLWNSNRVHEFTLRAVLAAWNGVGNG